MDRAALDAAYRATTYRVFVPHEAPLDLRIGERSRRLDDLLERESASEWAFITAWNPRGQPLPESENRARQHALIRLLEQRRLRAMPGSGIPPGDEWRAEESVLVIGVSPGEALEIARRFDQLAIVGGRRGCAAELVYCDPPS